MIRKLDQQIPTPDCYFSFRLASTQTMPAKLLARGSWSRQELLRSPYGFVPALSAPLIFVVLFSISGLWHLQQNFRYRQWWHAIFTLGCILEVAGHALRVLGHYDPFNVGAYTAMQCILVLTPAFFAALDFAILCKLTTIFPASYSLVNPKWIVPFFVTLDACSLAIQGGGAGVAAPAQAEGEDVNLGGHIVVVGLAIQLFGYIVFNTLLFVFVRRCVRVPPPAELWNKRTKTFIIATATSSGFIFVRSLFRLIEMSVGWSGVIARTEWCFYTFDAAMVTIAVFIFNIYHPGAYLPPAANPVTRNGSKSESASTEEKSLRDVESLGSTSPVCASVSIQLDH